MKQFHRWAALHVLYLIALPAFGQPKFDDPKVKMPDEKTMELIQHRTIKLTEALKALPASTPEYVRVDVEICLKAAEWAIRHHEFYDGGKAAVATLELGLHAHNEAAAGKPSWLNAPGKVVARAYRSRVDGSVQPYAVSYPAEYGKDKTKKWRLDIVLHGRDGTICETKFISSHNGKALNKDNDFVQIDIYGRGNNAYRWAGETDVFEVRGNFVDDEKTLGRDCIDVNRMVLRGFSMGGAGTWHLGLHHPSRWCAIGPGAGFSTTHSYAKSLPNPLPDSQEPLLHIYDAVDYAENAFNVPIVAYSGEKDPQKAAADNIEAKLKELKINTMTHLIAPGLVHMFPAEWQKKAEVEFAKYAAPKKEGTDSPKKIRFVTYTLKFGFCGWIELMELEQHYKQARVEGSFENGIYRVQTQNVQALRVWLDKRYATTQVIIDGEAIPIVVHGKSLVKEFHFPAFAKQKGKWIRYNEELAAERLHEKRKAPGVQGPIDDAFTHEFLCVKGTGVAWNDGPAKAADAQLERFEREWDKWMRGKLVVKKDTEVTKDDINSKNLILFGDPGSNTLIAKVLGDLPLKWNKDQLVVASQKYESEKYLPMMVYPNPLNTRKYVVLNSGHTFHEAEFRGSNVLLFPRLGDYAVVRPLPTAKDPAAFEVMKSGIFNDSWKFEGKE